MSGRWVLTWARARAGHGPARMVLHGVRLVVTQVACERLLAVVVAQMIFKGGDTWQ
jgi:hypothetical protein